MCVCTHTYTHLKRQIYLYSVRSENTKRDRKDRDKKGTDGEGRVGLGSVKREKKGRGASRVGWTVSVR